MGCKPSDKSKAKHKKGLWSPEEDLKLKNYVFKHGHGCWSSVPFNAGLQRNGKSCRLRWINYLRPGLKRGMFTPQEEETILSLHHLLGNKWSQIAQSLPGRTDNEIKNYWHTYLKKRVTKVEEPEAPTRRTQCTTSSSENTESILSTENIKDEMPSYESFQHIEKPPIKTDQAVPHHFDYAKEPHGSSLSLPKLLFAEWLSLDQEEGRSFVGNSGKPPVASSGGFDNGSSSNFQYPFMDAYLLHEGAFGSDLHDGLSNASVNEMFSSQFELETQISGNDQFVGSIYGDDILCSDFNMNNDLM